MILIVSLNIGFNFFIIIFDAYKHFKMYWVRRNRILAYRRTRMSNERVRRITEEANEKRKWVLKHDKKEIEVNLS